MANLLDLHCKRPNAGEALTESEIVEYAEQVPDWKVLERDGIPQLEREFRFKNFAQALAFTVQIGILAEKEDHHPAVTTEWGKVKVVYWTHVVKALHLNDFISAARADKIFSGD
jgi:4a-hydroxytetrahydrobiopterin dehydratase